MPVRCYVRKLAVKMSTLHIAFSLIDDERVTSAASLFVTDYSDTFNSAVAFELTTQVILCRTLVL